MVSTVRPCGCEYGDHGLIEKGCGKAEHGVFHGWPCRKCGEAFATVDGMDWHPCYRRLAQDIQDKAYARSLA